MSFFDKKILILILLFSTLVFITHFLITKQFVYGDGQYYYAYTRSIVIDKDLDFTNELTFFNREIKLTKMGKVGNYFSIGAPILWLPFFIFAHLLTTVLSFFMVTSTSGFSILYQLFVGIGCIIYGFLGLILSYKIVRQYYSKQISLLSVCLIYLSTNLLFYLSIDPVNSHSASFFISSLLLFVLTSKKIINNLKYIFLGLLSALLAMIRLQNIIFILLPLALILKNNNNKVRNLFKTLTCFIFGFLPQIIVWLFLYGTFISPYFLGGHDFNWIDPQIFKVLFSLNNGLFPYSPLLIIALIGLIILAYQKQILGLVGLTIFGLQLYIVSSWSVWWGGASYGSRMFVSLMPFFTIGLADILSKTFHKYKNITILASLFFVTINFYTIYKFLLTN